MNNQIFFFFYNLAHTSAFGDKLIVFFAEIFPYFIVLGAVVFLFFHHEVLPSRNPFGVFIKKWREVSFAFVSGFSAWILSLILKNLLHTLRPFDIFPNVVPLLHEAGYAFPSGHATFFMALAFSIFFFHRKAGYFFIGSALIIGICRIIAGVHSPVDILGGFILGFLIAFLIRDLRGKSFFDFLGPKV